MGVFLALVGTLWTTVGVLGVAAAYGGDLGAGVALTSVSVGVFPGLVLLALGVLYGKLRDAVDLLARLVERMEEGARNDAPAPPAPAESASPADASAPLRYGPTPPWERGAEP